NEVSQADLATWLETSATQGKPDKDTVLFNKDKSWQTYPAPCRKAGHTVTALLKKDLAIVEKLPPKLLPRYTVPLLAKDTKNWRERWKGYPVAPAEQWGYCCELGAYDREVKKIESI
ncbi:MAG: hypothetical protein LDL41_20490, partial [Coleofasciculus sp. S288]|nr:hypothetical protein [Coleofasciculus sp. S288]